MRGARRGIGFWPPHLAALSRIRFLWVARSRRVARGSHLRRAVGRCGSTKIITGRSRPGNGQGHPSSGARSRLAPSRPAAATSRASISSGEWGVGAHFPSAPRWKAVGLPQTTIGIPTAGGELLSAATALADAAEQPGASRECPAALALIEQALRVVSASVGVLARDAVPADAERDALGQGRSTTRSGGLPLSREQEAHLASTMHTLAQDISLTARSMCTCPRDGGTIARPEALKAPPSR